MKEEKEIWPGESKRIQISTDQRIKPIPRNSSLPEGTFHLTILYPEIPPTQSQNQITNHELVIAYHDSEITHNFTDTQRSRWQDGYISHGLTQIHSLTNQLTRFKSVSWLKLL